MLVVHRSFDKIIFTSSEQYKKERKARYELGLFSIDHEIWKDSYFTTFHKTTIPNTCHFSHGYIRENCWIKN